MLVSKKKTRHEEGERAAEWGIMRGNALRLHACYCSVCSGGDGKFRLRMAQRCEA
jgi:hypothetical protein